MGTKLRKKWDLPLERRSSLAVLAVSFLIGGGGGCLFAALSGGEGIDELCAYLTGYMELAAENQLPRGLWTVLWGQLKYPLAAAVLGLTALGAVGLPILFGLRGFFLSFPTACFLRVFGGRGLLPAFALFALPALLWAPALFLLGASGFCSARRLLSRALSEGGGGLPAPVNWYQAGACLCLSMAAGLLEFWVVPVLLRGLAKVVL